VHDSLNQNKTDFFKLISFVVNQYMPTVLNMLQMNKYEEFSYDIVNNNLPMFRLLTLDIYNELSEIIDYNTKIHMLQIYDESALLDEDVLEIATTPSEVVDFQLYRNIEPIILKIIERNIAYYYRENSFYPALFLDTNGRILNKIKNVNKTFAKFPKMLV
jgi:hypothetical protein